MSNELSFKNIVISTLGSNSAILINKKLVLTLGIEKAWFLSFLIDQYKFFENRNQIDIDGSFYTTDESMSLYTTFSIKKIAQLKKEMGIDNYVYFDTIGYPTRTKVVINFEKIFELLNTDKTQEEIAIKNKYYELEGFSEDDLTEENLKTWRKDALKIFCKKNRISYRGHDPKEKIIEKILKAKNTVLTDVEPSENTSVSSYAKTGELVTPKQDNQLRQNGSTSYAKMGVLVTPKQDNQLRQNGSTSYAKMGVHNTYYKYILNNTSSSNDKYKNNTTPSDDVDETFFENDLLENADKNKMDFDEFKIEAILEENQINYNQQIKNELIKVISSLNIENETLFFSFLKKICDSVSKNKDVKHKTPYFLSCLKNPDKALYQNLKINFEKKIKDANDEKEKKDIEIKTKQKLDESALKRDSFIKFFKSLNKSVQEELISKAENTFIADNSLDAESLNNFKLLKNLSEDFYFSSIFPTLFKIWTTEYAKE